MTERDQMLADIKALREALIKSVPMIVNSSLAFSAPVYSLTQEVLARTAKWEEA